MPRVRIVSLPDGREAIEVEGFSPHPYDPGDPESYRTAQRAATFEVADAQAAAEQPSDTTV